MSDPIATSAQRSATSDAIDILAELHRQNISFASVLKDLTHTDDDWNRAITYVQLLAMARGGVQMVNFTKAEGS